MQLLGELFALLSAGIWAVCNFAFASNMEVFSPMMFNFIKCFITTIVILLLLFLLQIELPVESLNPYVYLAISGLCGIAIGDTFYLNALQSLGARKTLLMETLAPPFTGLIAFIYFGTTISIFGWAGIAAIIYGLYLVINEQKDEANTTSSHPNDTELLFSKEIPLIQEKTYIQNSQQQNLPKQMKNLFQDVKSFVFNHGVLNAMAAMFCQSLGMVLSSAALQYGELDTLLATFIRLLAAVFMLIPMLIFWKKETFTIPKLSMLETSQLLAVVLISTLICIYFQQLSLVYTRPEISQTLLATSTIFGLLYGKFKGENISKKQYLGSIIAFVGVGVIVWC